MKKISIAFILCIISFFITPVFWANTGTLDCTYTEWGWSGSISSDLSGCFENSKVISVGDAKLDWWFKTEIWKWVNNIALILSLLAVGSIIYGALLLTLSTWEDEKIKKAKDVVKWGILWFLWVISASAIITLVVKIMYSI